MYVYIIPSVLYYAIVMGFTLLLLVLTRRYRYRYINIFTPRFEKITSVVAIGVRLAVVVLLSWRC